MELATRNTIGDGVRRAAELYRIKPAQKTGWLRLAGTRTPTCSYGSAASGPD